MKYCPNAVVLEVEKYMETRDANGRLLVRTFSFRYNAYIKGKHNILRYDNGHDFDEYHRHVYDVQTGEQIISELLERSDFPVLSDILDELEKTFS